MKENVKPVSKIDPTDDMIKMIFFGNVDLSKFSRPSDGHLVTEIKTIIQVWENNRYKLVK